MKLLLDYCKKRILNLICGSSLTNTKIRNLMVLHFIKSIWKKSIVGNDATNSLLYDTKYTVFIPDQLFDDISHDLIFVVQSTAREFEYIIKNKVDKKKYPNYDYPHSPDWFFSFQPVPVGTKLPDSDIIMGENTLEIQSETFEIVQTANHASSVKVSIRSTSSNHTEDIVFNKEAFEGVRHSDDGKYLVQFGILDIERKAVGNSKNAVLTLTSNKDVFLVNDNMTDKFSMISNELYISGRNANDTYKGVQVLRIADKHIMNQQVHITYNEGRIKVYANGDVRYRDKIINNSGVNISKGSAIWLNQSIQIVIS